MVRELSTIYAGVDPVHQPIPIRPVLHYMMGGIDVDIDGATLLPGLYAAGEVACVSLNGANRLGSNSLTECLVFGARTGESALRFARGSSEGGDAALVRQVEEEGARVDALRGRRGSERLSALRTEMQRTMERGCGVYRDAGSMQETVRELARLRERVKDLAVEDASRVFNTEIVAALELENMLEVAQAIAVSAEHRRESRGAHTRRDAPRRDDANFLYHTLCFRGEPGPRLDKKPVTLGRWVPEERKY
jgi:fumarate reductase flavoprotein subunit